METPEETPAPMVDELPLDSQISEMREAEGMSPQVSIDELEGAAREALIVEYNTGRPSSDPVVIEELGNVVSSFAEGHEKADAFARAIQNVMEGEGGTGGRISPDSGASGIFQYTKDSREDAFNRGVKHPDGRPYTAEEWAELPADVQFRDWIERLKEWSRIDNEDLLIEYVADNPTYAKVSQLAPAHLIDIVQRVESGENPEEIIVLSGGKARQQAAGMQVRQPDGSVVVTVKSMNDYYSGNAR